jgi:hypothetical protein
MKELKSNSLKLLLYLTAIALEGLPSQTENAYCIVSLDQLIKGTGLSRQTVITVTTELEKFDYIRVFKTGNMTNVYAINPNKMWKSGNDKKWKALYYNKTLEGYVVRGNIIRMYQKADLEIE